MTLFMCQLEPKAFAAHRLVLGTFGLSKNRLLPPVLEYSITRCLTIFEVKSIMLLSQKGSFFPPVPKVQSFDLET